MFILGGFLLLLFFGGFFDKRVGGGFLFVGGFFLFVCLTRNHSQILIGFKENMWPIVAEDLKRDLRAKQAFRGC